MIGNKRPVIWAGIILILACLFGTGYYLLNQPLTISAGSAADSLDDLKRGEEIAEGRAREKSEDAKRREELLRSFSGLLDGPPERLVLEAVLKGDSAAAARTAKIWALSEPESAVARSLVEAFACAGAIGKGNCADYNSSADFHNWRKDLKARYPDNPHISMMTAGIADDLDAVAGNFNKAVKMKGSDLDFNFDVPLCSYWITEDMIARLRADWNRERSVPGGLRLVQRLTCANGDHGAAAKASEEARRVLKTLIEICPVNDLESVRNAYVAEKIR